MKAGLTVFYINCGEYGMFCRKSGGNRVYSMYSTTVTVENTFVWVSGRPKVYTTIIIV